MVSFSTVFGITLLVSISLAERRLPEKSLRFSKACLVYSFIGIALKSKFLWSSSFSRFAFGVMVKILPGPPSLLVFIIFTLLSIYAWKGSRKYSLMKIPLILSVSKSSI